MGKSVSILPDICDTGAAVWHWSTSPLISTGPSASLTCCRAVWQTLHSPPGIPLVSYQYPPPDCPSFFIFIPLLLFYSTKKKKKVSFESTKKCLIVMQEEQTVAPMQSDVPAIHLKLHVRALSWHLQWELLPREKWERMKGLSFSVLLKDTSRGHMFFVARFGCHGDQTRDLSVSKRVISPWGQPAVKWLIIMQEREIRASAQMIVLEKQWLIVPGQTLTEPREVSGSPVR